MTIIEQIKAEIERQIKDPQEHCYGVSSINKIRELLSFLDTLESEKPVPKDLEEAAERFSKNISNGLYFRDLRVGFIAGAEWQKEQMMDEWLKDRDGCFWDGVEEGKKAMREQMMKEAVEKTVCLVPSLVGPKMFTTSIELSADELKGFKPGDKVRIIIVKEDEK